MPASVESQEHAVARAGKIFAILRQAAERGEPCPKNSILAERFGTSRHCIINAFHFLEANGMISVERRTMSRVVTIRATGQQTAPVMGKPHWSRRKAA